MLHVVVILFHRSSKTALMKQLALKYPSVIKGSFSYLPIINNYKKKIPMERNGEGGVGGRRHDHCSN